MTKAMYDVLFVRLCDISILGMTSALLELWSLIFEGQKPHVISGYGRSGVFTMFIVYFLTYSAFRGV